MKMHLSEDEVAWILEQVNAQGKSIEEICRANHIPVKTFHFWRRRFRAAEAMDEKKIQELMRERDRLQRELAERKEEINILKKFMGK